jgi:hypothetical protein
MTETMAPVLDVILATNDVLDFASVDEEQREPPLSSAIQISERVTLGPIPEKTTAAVIEKCRVPHVALGPLKGLYALYAEGRRGIWDESGSLEEALALTHLVRPTQLGYEFTAQVITDGAGECLEVEPAPVRTEMLRRYLIPNQRRRWLTDDDGRKLADLVGGYRSLKIGPGTRLSNALWYFTASAYLYDPNVRLAILVSILEGLVSTSRERALAQFRTRVIGLAQAFGLGGYIDRKWCDRTYEFRSLIAHGSRLINRREDYGSDADLSRDVQNRMTLLEHLGRAVLSRALLDERFRTLLLDEAALEARWPVRPVACPRCQGELEDSIPVVCPRCQRKWTAEGPSSTA